MGNKFQDIYRIESTRMNNWNYGWKGFYYVTICTEGRECYFGDILDGKMIFSEIGKIAETEWLKSPEIRPDMNLTLDEYIIMPNHIHGIIKIGRNVFNKFNDDHAIHGSRDAMHGVSTSGTRNPSDHNMPGPQRKNLSSIMRGFKSSVTKDARQINPDFAWQDRFHDHLIRDEETLNKIRHYIKTNPKNWNKDRFNPKNRKDEMDKK